MAKIFNVTGWRREVMAAGKKYTFEPFSESKEIYDLTHVEHIELSHGYLGLIGLNWDEDREKQYGDYKTYKKEKEIKGLLAALKHAEQCLAYETNAKEACEKTPNAAHELRTFNVKKFKDNVTLINRWLAEAGYDDEVKKEAVKEVVAKRPDWSKTKDEPKSTEDSN